MFKNYTMNGCMVQHAWTRKKNITVILDIKVEKIQIFLNSWNKELTNKKSLHFVTDELTMADITIYNILDLNLRYFSDLLKNYKQLNKFVVKHLVIIQIRMESIPKLAEYKNSEKRLKAVNGDSACIDSSHTLVKTDRKQILIIILLFPQ